MASFPDRSLILAARCSTLSGIEGGSLGWLDSPASSRAAGAFACAGTAARTAGYSPAAGPRCRALQAIAMSNDKGIVDSPALVPTPKDTAKPDVVNGLLENDLLEGLTRMTLRGYQPSAFLLVRLTDGRVKLVHTPRGADQAREEANRIRNEYGPLEVAFSVSVNREDSGIALAVDDLGEACCSAG